MVQVYKKQPFVWLDILYSQSNPLLLKTFQILMTLRDRALTAISKCSTGSSSSASMVTMVALRSQRNGPGLQPAMIPTYLGYGGGLIPPLKTFKIFNTLYFCWSLLCLTESCSPAKFAELPKAFGISNTALFYLGMISYTEVVMVSCPSNSFQL